MPRFLPRALLWHGALPGTLSVGLEGALLRLARKT